MAGDPQRNHSTPPDKPAKPGLSAIHHHPAGPSTTRHIRQQFPDKHKQERFSFKLKLHRMPPENKS
jgi:hypothetical protein